MSDQCPEESLERNKDIHTNTTYNYKLYRPQEYQADQGYQAYQKHIRLELDRVKTLLVVVRAGRITGQSLTPSYKRRAVEVQ